MRLLRHALIIGCLLVPTVCIAGRSRANTPRRDWLTEKDNGRVVVVKQGEQVKVRLPTYHRARWHLTEGSPVLGYPAERSEARPRGNTWFTWNTGSARSIGTHEVALELKRNPLAPVKRAFKFTVVVEK